MWPTIRRHHVPANRARSPLAPSKSGASTRKGATMKLPSCTSRNANATHRGRKAFLATLLSVSLALTTGAPLAFAAGTDGVATTAAVTGTQLTSEDLSFHSGDIVQIRPHGCYRTVSVEGDAAFNGYDNWLYSLGTSSKHRLAVKDGGYYTIQAFQQFIELDDNARGFWDLDGGSKRAGTTIHVWSNGKNEETSQWAFERNSDGTYYIKNRYSGLYVSLKDRGNNKDKDKNKLEQQNKEDAIAWDVDVVYGNQAASTHSYASSWMSRYSDDLYLSDMTIPGTHDSGTCYTWSAINVQDSFTSCQQYYIDEQLTAGIRFFDIRVGIDGLEDRDPYINHGGTVCEDRENNWLRLSAVVKDMKSFLEANPTEAVIMMVSNSGGDTDNQTSSLAKLMDENPDLFYTSSAVPKLGDVRGKIVLFTRFAPSGPDASTHEYGLCMDSWGAYNDAYAHTKGLVQIKSTSELEVYVQDNYSSHADDKIAYVQGAFKEADTKRTESATLGKKAWVFNYTSCTKNNPFTAARNMNERLYKENCLSDDTPGFLGIVAMDFIDARQAESVWKQNTDELASTEDKVVTGTSSKGLKYTIANDKASITGYAGSSSSVTLPKSIKGAPVVSASLKNAGIKTLKTGKATELRTLNCQGNKLGTLNVSKNTKLRTLTCQNNRLTKVVLSSTANKALKRGCFVIGKASQNKFSKAERTRLCVNYSARTYAVTL